MVKKQSTFLLLFKMMLRTLRRGFMQFLALIAIGAIAVTLFTGLISNAEVFSTQAETVYRDGNLADLWVTTKSYDKGDMEMISSLLEDGESIESRLYLPCSGQSHSFYLCVSEHLPTISKAYDGEYSDQDFLLVDKAIEEETGSTFHVGSEITFSLDLSSYLTGDAKKMVSFLDLFVKDGGENIFKKDKIDIKSEITGFMYNPENINKAAYQSSVVLMSDSVFRKCIKKLFYDNFKENYVDAVYSLVAPYMGLNDLDSDVIANPNQYLLKLKDDRDIDSLKKQIQEKYSTKEEDNLYYVTSRTQMPFYMTIYNDVKQARQFTFVFPMVFFLVAVLVILTTISQIVLKDRNQIGTLKAIGVSKKYIYGLYISLTMMLVLISTIIGEIIGPLLIPSILGKKYQIIYTLPDRIYNFPVLYCILTALVFLLVAGVVTYLVCRKEVSLKPTESMRPKVVEIKTKEKNNEPKKKTAGFFSYKMAFRNIWMNKAKSLMVIIGVMGCTALLLCGFGIEDTVYYGIDHDCEVFRAEDLTLTFSSSKSREDIENDLYSIDGISYVESSVSSTTTLRMDDGTQENTTIRIIPDSAKLNKVEFPQDGIAVSDKVARKLNISVGQNITFTYNSVEYEGKVNAIYSAFFYNGIILHENSSVFGSSLSFVYSSAGVNVKDDADVNAVKEKLLSLSYVSDCKTQKDWSDKISQTMSGVLVMTTAVKVFAILLGVVVLYNLTLMNFRERSRDIATLKVLGFNKIEILKSLIVESMTLTLIGVLFGLALGYPFMLAVMKTNIVELVDYLYHIFFKSFIYSFLLTFGVALLINIVLSFRIKKIQMIESLKSVE
jgi:ABC-type antimicrobial peptide transport system permease subunit